MPANPKHLSTPIQRFAKITAGFIGGYFVTEFFHMFLMLWLDAKNVLITIRYGGFIIWATLMVLAFVAKNGWKIWGIYIAISLFFYAFIYFFNH